MRVLIVDDFEDCTQALAALFRLDGHETAEADGGPAALRLAASFRPDVLLIEPAVGGNSGFELCRTLRRQPEPVKVAIAITYLGGPDARQACGLAGFDAYFLKPASYDAVAAVVDELVRQREPVGVGRLR